MRIGPFLALLLVPAVAPAQSFRVLDTLVLDYRGDNGNDLEGDDDYFLGYTKLYLDGEYEETVARAQIDGVYFFREPDLSLPPGQESPHRNDLRIERFSLSHRWGDATFTLGDFHKQLGRGIALSLRRVDELGVDKALRGGQVEWEGDTVSWNAFGGLTNISNLDGVTQKFVEDPLDLIVGAQGTLHLGTADLSAYGLALFPKNPEDPELSNDQTLLGGGFVELPATDWLTLYAEAAFSEYAVGGNVHDGKAAYATADMNLEVVNLLLEGIYLDQFQVRGSKDNVLFRQRLDYNQPPTLERIDQEVFDYWDVRGGRAKVSKSFWDGDLVVYVNGLWRRYGVEARDRGLIPADAYHGYTGFELAYGGGRSRWFASGGYREELREDHVAKTVVHGETDWVQSLGRGWAVHLTVNHESRREEGHDFLRGTSLLGVEHDGKWSLTAEYGYDTANADVRNHFFAGIATYRPVDWIDLRTVVGSERGGIKCIGGVCREYPAFAGARFEASVQHDLL